jgi:hypothetical protein
MSSGQKKRVDRKTFQKRLMPRTAAGEDRSIGA